MNKQEIMDAYLFLREHNHDIPDNVLDFMKDVSLRELERINNCRTCFSCQHDGHQLYVDNEVCPCRGCRVGTEYLNFKVKL